MADLCHTLNELSKCQNNALKPNEMKKFKKSVKNMTNILKNAKKHGCTRRKNTSKDCLKLKRTSKKTVNEVMKYGKILTKKCKKQQKTHMDYMDTIYKSNKYNEYSKKCMKNYKK